MTNTGNIGIDASGHWGISKNPATDFARNGVISENHVSYCKSPVEGGAGIYLMEVQISLLRKTFRTTMFMVLP